MVRVWGIIVSLALAYQTAFAAGLHIPGGTTPVDRCRILSVVIAVHNQQIDRLVQEIGLTPYSIYHLQLLARSRDLLIVVRERQHDAIQYINKPGYLPKPATIKLKSAASGPNSGLVVRPDGPKEKWKPWERDEVEKLEKLGFTFNEQGVLIGPESFKFYSDIDLQGIYRREGGTYKLIDANSHNIDDVKISLLPDSIAEGVTHGPNDNFRAWNPRLRKDEMLRQPYHGEKFLLVTPEGTAALMENSDDLRKEYHRRHIVWPYEVVGRPK